MLFGAAVSLLVLCGPGAVPVPSKAPGPLALFEEITGPAGLEFVYRSGATGELRLPEIMGGGAALFDFDRDGDLDVYLVQGAMPSGDRLLRNDLDRPGAVPRLVDVTESVGLVERGFGMGVAAGDYDNDGFVDLYVANLAGDALLHNDEGGVLRDATARAGVDTPGWTVAAVFLDFDRDGWLDLFVVDYVDWSPERDVTCHAHNTRRDYCGPSAYPPAVSRLFRNRGDGTFEPYVSDTFAALPGAGLGVLALDADDDRFLDLLVANDGMPNRLWRNRAGRSFHDDGLAAGVAVNRYGLSEGSMGIAAGDVDGDGDEDVLLSHLTGETNTLYVRVEPGLYEDATGSSGLGPPSLPFTGFGTAFVDVDHDRDLDLLVVNGAVRREHGGSGERDAASPATETGELGQPNLLFLNDGTGRFSDATHRMPPSFSRAETSRGLAVGDLDDDRIADFLVVQVDGPARLYRGTAGPPRLGLRLLDAHGRDALGARVVVRYGATELVRVVRTDGSYASASDPRVLFPAPDAGDAVSAIVVSWPDGATDEWTRTALDALLRGAGEGYVTLRARGAER